jgi:phospholipase D-like protein
LVCAGEGWHIALQLWKADTGALVPEVTRTSERACIVKGPWGAQLLELLSAANEDLLLACPFITRTITQWISRHLASIGKDPDLHITCITNIKPSSVLAGSLELDGLADLAGRFSNFDLFHMPSLHAKVYAADRECAIVTSGNLTEGGLTGNCEYGVILHDPDQVKEIRGDFEAYARLGALISVEEAVTLAEDLSGLRGLYQATERKVIKEAGSLFRRKLLETQERVLRFRARGTSTHAIFCNTVEYLLSKGPLRTVELHPLVQRMHPDICDDRTDRVIDGVNFGKKWKHHVRTAQQALKRAGKIEFDGQMWHLTAVS